MFMLLIIQQVLEAHGLKPVVLKPKEVSQSRKTGLCEQIFTFAVFILTGSLIGSLNTVYVLIHSYSQKDSSVNI